MDITQILQSSGALDSAARELGIDPGVAAAGATALLPAILGGFQNSAQSTPGGLGGLASIIGQLGGGGLLESVTGAAPTNVDAGHSVLGQIFGGQAVNDQVVNHAAAQSGIDASTLQRLLPIVAMLVAGYLAHQQAGTQPAAPAAAPAGAPAGGLGGILGSVFSSVLGGGSAAAPAAAGAAPAAGGALGGLASILDMNHDGNPLDDIIGLAGQLRR